MNGIGDAKPGPIEVWLSQKNMEINCMVVFEDEETLDLPIDTISMRGAQREITGYLLRQGYEAIGRWKVESRDVDGAQNETVRSFRLSNKKTASPFER